MAQHNANGLALAEFLAGHPKVTRVLYPGLPTTRSTRWRERRCAASAACWPSTWARSRRRARVVERVQLFALAESLGGVESLIGHPASMTHASVPPERRAALGLGDGLVRISAGIEDVADLSPTSRRR